MKKEDTTDGATTAPKLIPAEKLNADNTIASAAAAALAAAAVKAKVRII